MPSVRRDCSLRCIAVGHLLQNRSKDIKNTPAGPALHERLLEIEDDLRNIRTVLDDCPPELQLGAQQVTEGLSAPL